MDIFKIIQGGMGVAISDWNLARAVSMKDQLGVVSGTGIASVLVSRLRNGDLGDHMRRALSNFPFQDSIQRIMDRYYNSDDLDENSGNGNIPMWSLNPSSAIQELTVVANFVEVFLAREKHDGAIGLNLLEKVQMPTMASLYGAMLAGVTFVIMGAGIPTQVPGILDDLVNHQPVSYRLDVRDADAADDFRLFFDPQQTFPGISQQLGSLQRPYFLPIISSNALAKAMLKRASGKVDGFIIEAPIAGGHNAPPRGVQQLNEQGEPIYGVKDQVNLEQIAKLGLPFWLAGGYDSPEQIQFALDAGAAGVQVGTAFAFSNESGLESTVKQQIIDQVVEGTIKVRTDPDISPTGFPFKVTQLTGTLSDAELFNKRKRLCNIGFLRQLYKSESGKVIFRCAAEPVDQFVAKGGVEEDTIGKGCLCNNLLATAGYPQPRKDQVQELPLVTAGDSLPHIAKYLKAGQRTYSAEDVLDYLLS